MFFQTLLKCVRPATIEYPNMMILVMVNVEIVIVMNFKPVIIVKSFRRN